MSHNDEQMTRPSTPGTAGADAVFDPALNMARQALYRFAAVTLLDPRAGSWHALRAFRSEGLVSLAAALVRELPNASADSLGPGEQPLSALDPDRVLASLPTSERAFHNLYEATFGLLVSNACPPYGTEYIDAKFSFQRSNGLADVSGYYRAFGMSVSSEHPERHDHVVLELEFMAFLLGLERQAAVDDVRSEERRLVCRSAQKQFFADHVAWWAPAFAKLLAREAGAGFYLAAAEFLGALIAAERALLGVQRAGRAEQPQAIELPEECDGCALAK